MNRQFGEYTVSSGMIVLQLLVCGEEVPPYLQNTIHVNGELLHVSGDKVNSKRFYGFQNERDVIDFLREATK